MESNLILHRQLVDLFKETGPAHHQAYFKTNGADDEWPLWYADFMQEKLNAFLKTKLTRSKIVQLLVDAAEEQEASGSKVDWTEYYAEFFLRNLRSAAKEQ